MFESWSASGRVEDNEVHVEYQYVFCICIYYDYLYLRTICQDEDVHSNVDSDCNIKRSDSI